MERTGSEGEGFSLAGRGVESAGSERQLSFLFLIKVSEIGSGFWSLVNDSCGISNEKKL